MERAPTEHLFVIKLVLGLQKQ